MTRARDTGFTLIEVLVSLALFAMIAGAGLSVLDQILRTQSRTDGRLDRLAALQRMMHLVARDLSESTPGTLQGDATTLTLARSAITVTYALTEGRMVRQVARNRADAIAQPLLADVANLRWQFLDPSGTWQDTWPPGDDDVALHAVAMTVTLDAGELRRVVAVPRAGPP